MGMGMGGMGGMAGYGGGFAGGEYGSGAYARSGQAAEIQPEQGLEAQAAGAEVGEFYRYDVSTPVSLARRQTGLVPIIADDVDAERISVFRQGRNRDRLLHAVRLTNSTDHHLAAGPVAVFDERVYAGDARIGHVRPGEQRLLSYALDLEVEASVDSQEEEPATASVTLEKGLLTIVRTQKQRVLHRFRVLGDKSKRIVVEHPRPAGEWHIIEPQEPLESTDEHLRYEIAADPNETSQLAIVHQRTTTEKQRLWDVADDAAKLLIADKATPQAARATLEEMLALRRRARDLAKQLESLERQSANLVSDQTRVRSNMQPLDRAGELYRRYYTAMAEIEDEIQELRKQQQSTRERLAEVEQQLVELGALKETTERNWPPKRASDDPFGH
jgi:hypothetical protein